MTVIGSWACWGKSARRCSQIKRGTPSPPQTWAGRWQTEEGALHVVLCVVYDWSIRM